MAEPQKTTHAPFATSGADRFRLLVTLLVFSIAISGFAYAFFRRHEANVYATARQQLETVADMKQESIHGWREERAADADWMLNASVIPTRVQTLFTQSTPVPPDLVRWLIGWQKQGRYSRVLMLDRHGHVRAAAPEGISTDVTDLEPTLTEVMQTHRVVWCDLHHAPDQEHITMGLGVPLLVRGAGEPELVGMMYFEIDSRNFLFPLLQTWPIPNHTAESLLARRDGDSVVFLSPLRYQADSVLHLKIDLDHPDVPAVRAVLGEHGTFTGTDYRGVPVLASFRQIEDSPWILVAKQDLAEIEAPLRAWGWMLSASVLLLIVAAAAGVGLAWRTREIYFHRRELAERKVAEAALIEAKSHLDLALESAHMGVWRVTLPEGQRHLDAQACRLLGLDHASYQGTAAELYAQVHPEDRPAVIAAWAQTASSGAAYDISYRTIWPDGSVHHVVSRGLPVCDVSGQAYAVNGLIWDVTASKQTEAALRETNTLLQEAQRIARLGSYTLDVKTGRWTSSAMLDEIFGLTDPAFVRDVQGWWQILHPEDRAVMIAYLKDEVIGQKQPFNRIYRIVRLHDHATRWVQGLGELLCDEAGQVRAMVGTIQDITERKLAEAALEESQRRLAHHIEQTPVAVIEWDLAGHVVAWNPAAERIFGYPAAEALGRTAAELITPLHPAAAAGEISSATNQPGRLLNHESRTRSGRRIHCDWFNTPMIDEAGQPIGTASLVLDVTERRQHEEERDLLLREVQRKNEELEGIIYVASHDLRSPLVNVQGFVQRLDKACAELTAQLPPDLPPGQAASVATARDRIRKALGYIRSSAEKMDGLISGLLRVARLGRIVVNAQPVDMNRLLREALNTLTFQIQQAGADVQLATLPPCHGDPALLSQVFGNLLDNALKYRAPDRPLRIIVSGHLAGPDLIYSVADSGLGIAPAHLDKIWEMFHRLNPDGPASGEGLGLKVVRRLIDRHRGRVWVESAPGIGSTFFVALPADPPANPTPPPVS